MQDEHNGNQFKSEFYQKTFQGSIACSINENSPNDCVVNFKTDRPAQQQKRSADGPGRVRKRPKVERRFMKSDLVDWNFMDHESWSSSFTWLSTEVSNGQLVNQI